MRILYATYVSLFPSNSGERIRAIHLITALEWLGCHVEAIVGNYNGVNLTAQNREHVRFHEIPFPWPRLRQSPQTYIRANDTFVDQVAALHRAAPLTAIILDYGFIGAQIAPLKRLGVPVVLGTHNLESRLTGEIRKTSIGGKIAIALRQGIEWAHERAFFRNADAVICVSKDDREAYGRFLPKDRLHVVPNFIDVPDVYRNMPRENRIILSGSFDNFQNAEGLQWFVKQVWDDELSSLVSLCLAGRGSVGALKNLDPVEGVFALGERETLLPEIARSRCAIVPLLSGGGTRIKCLEAMAARTPIVATTKGCEGIAHDNAFLVADGAAAFKAAILDIVRNEAPAKARADRARDIFDLNYGLHANAPRLERAIKSAAQVHARSRFAVRGRKVRIS